MKRNLKTRKFPKASPIGKDWHKTNEQHLPIRNKTTVYFFQIESTYFSFFDLSILMKRVNVFDIAEVKVRKVQNTMLMKTMKKCSYKLTTSLEHKFDPNSYLKVRPKWYIVRLLDGLIHLIEENYDGNLIKQSNITSETRTNQSRKSITRKQEQIKVGYKISSRTSCFLSDDKTACCHSVIAVSGGHIGLLQRALNVISLT